MVEAYIMSRGVGGLMAVSSPAQAIHSSCTYTQRDKDCLTSVSYEPCLADFGDDVSACCTASTLSLSYGHISSVRYKLELR